MVYENLCINCMKKKASSDKVCPHCGFDVTKYNISDFQLPPYTGLSDGRYIVGRMLGSGGFGITYIAFDTRLEVQVAIKELFVANKVKRQSGKTVLMDTTEDGIREYKEIKRRFMQEARTMAELENVEGVVKVRDYFSENDTAYIVMEYLDGKTLKEILRENKKRMSVAQAVTLFEPVIHSLSKMHKAGIIHRDISLDNIMVTKDKRVKLIDLGGEKRIENISDTDRTIAIKKSVYTPVEQILGKSSSIGPWTDVYALAVTIYRCICGKFPKASGERENDKDIEKPSKLGVHITRKQEETLLKALALDRKDRIQSVDQLLAGLERKKEKKWPVLIAVMIIIGIITGKNVKEQLKKYVGGIVTVTEETTAVEISESDRSALEEYAKQSIEMIVGMDDDQAEEIVHPSSILNTCEESMVASVRSWMNVKDELGKYKKILSYDIDVNRENIEINVICEFDNGESNVKIILARKDLSLVVIEFDHIQ